MRISVITVCLNDVDKITKTIESVLCQNYRDIEYIIIDGVSTDGTLDVIKSFYEKYRNIKFISERDSGIYNAMNKGLRLSTGSYINFLNSGDYYCDKYVISDMVGELRGRRVDVIYGGVILYRKNQKNIIQNEPYGKLKYLFAGYMPCHQAIFARKETFYPRGFSEKYKLGGDKNWLYLCHRRKYRIKYYDRLIAYHELGGVGSSSQPKYQRLVVQESEQILDNYYPWFMPLKKMYRLSFEKLLEMKGYRN